MKAGSNNRDASEPHLEQASSPVALIAEDPRTTSDSSGPNVVRDLDDILRSFASKLPPSRTRKSSQCNRLSQTTILSYEEHDDFDGMSNGTSSYNSGLSSSTDDSFESENVPFRYSTDVVKNTDVAVMNPTDAVNGDISVKVAENYISAIQFNKRKATPESKERKPKLPLRSKRLDRTRTIPTKIEPYPNVNADDHIPASSKSIAHLWMRKKPLDQVTLASTDCVKESRSISSDINVLQRVIIPLDDQQIQSVVQAIVPNEENFCLSSIVPNQQMSVVANIVQPNPESINETKKLKSNLGDQAHHCMERFECDTGEVFAEGRFQNGRLLEKRRIRGFDCDTGDRVTKQELAAAHILSYDLRHYNPNVKVAVTLETRAGPPLNAGIEPAAKAFPRERTNPLAREPASPTSVIENMELFFAKSNYQGMEKLLRDSLDSSVSSISSNSTLSQSSGDEIPDPLLDDNGSGTESLSQSDRHQARHLRSTKVLVRKSNQQPSTNPMNSSSAVLYTLPLNRRGVVTHRSISILLVKPVDKVFEIVAVDVIRSTLLKDTLQAARFAATNPVLARQKYVSLCSDVKVLSNMTSPMSKLMQKPTFYGSENTTANFNQAPETDPEMWMRREMERRLWVAVPETSNVTECQTIRRILWKNPKLQVWWSIQMKSDDFQILHRPL